MPPLDWRNNIYFTRTDDEVIIGLDGQWHTTTITRDLNRGQFLAKRKVSVINWLPTLSVKAH